MTSPQRIRRGLLARLTARVLIAALLVGFVPTPADAGVTRSSLPSLPSLAEIGFEVTTRPEAFAYPIEFIKPKR